MNHPAHDKLIAIAKGWQMERGSAEKWEPCTSGAALRLIGNDLGKFIRIAPGQPEVMQAIQVDAIMHQAQVFASAWALVGGRFDSGEMLGEAEAAKAELRTMLTPTHAAAAGKESGND